jgi:putrescine aminotransferase
MKATSTLAAAHPVDAERLAGVYREHVNSGWTKMISMLGGHVETRAMGNYVFDESGQRFLDCGGFGVFMLGHRHPVILERVRAQLDVQPLPNRLFFSPAVAQGAESLAGIAPEGMEYVYFTTSGSEAVETSIKLGRMHGCTRLVSAEGGFHGKTMGAVSVAGSDKYSDPFAPLLPDAHRVAFGDAGALEALLCGHGDKCCVVLEPIQGEAGVVVPPAGYLAEVRSLCDRHAAFLVLDEIQTGLGRCGDWWAAVRENIVPDVLLTGKALSGGVVPVSAVVATPEAFGPLNRDPFLNSTTFSNNQLGATAATATIDVIKQDGLIDRARTLGRHLEDLLSDAMDSACPEIVVDVRSAGLMIAVEFIEPHIAGDCFLDLLEQRVIANVTFGGKPVCRLTPSAYLEEQDVRWLAEALHAVGTELAKRY